MLALLAGSFGYCVVSALIPVINAEAYVAAWAAALDQGLGLWGLAFTAAAGQMVGKTVYYLLGRSSLEWSWVQRKTSSPRWQAALTRWRRRIGGRPWLAGLVLLVSAYGGVPPLMVLSVVAGQLHVPLPLFVTVGFVGRLARFGSLVGVVQMALG